MSDLTLLQAEPSREKLLTQPNPKRNSVLSSLQPEAIQERHSGWGIRLRAPRLIYVIRFASLSQICLRQTSDNSGIKRNASTYTIPQFPKGNRGQRENQIRIAGENFPYPLTISPRNSSLRFPSFAGFI